MARLGIDKEFLTDFSKLEKAVQKATLEAIDKFAEHAYAGLHLEKLNHAKDDRIRTIRVDQFWRGVVLAPESGQNYTLIRVLPHDDAITYAASHRFTVNQALGIIEVRNETALEQIQPTLEIAATRAHSKLLAHVSDSDLTRLGIDANTQLIARLFSTLAELEAMQNMIPEAQYNALLGLALGQSPEEVWTEISQYATGEPIDTHNIVRAMERTPGRVVFVESNQELERILEHPFALWRTFLQPAQRKIAYAPRYAGPAQVTGGAGTGKTVTALHRTAFLARRASEELFSEESGPSVLLTTFTWNLAEALGGQFDLLADDSEVRRQVEILERGQARRPDRSAGAWDKTHRDRREGAERLLGSGDGEGRACSTRTSFLVREWEQVILAQDLRTEQEYLSVRALGRARRSERRSDVRCGSSRSRSRPGCATGRDTFAQLADEAARVLREAV